MAITDGIRIGLATIFQLLGLINNKGDMMVNTINKFFDTAVGKSLETFLWTLGAYVITVAAAFVARVQWSPELMALGAPGLINWIIYTAKVIVDKEVPTFPNSQPMMLVPKVDTSTVAPAVNANPVSLVVSPGLPASVDPTVVPTAINVGDKAVG